MKEQDGISDQPPQVSYSFTNSDGEEEWFEHAADAVEAAMTMLSDGLRSRGEAGAQAAWENIAPLVAALREHGHDQRAENRHAHHGEQIH